jgi:hypothetical protein
MSPQTVMRISLAVVICSMTLTSCQCATQQAKTADAVVEELQRIHMTMKDRDAKKRITAALSLRQNTVLDREPILIAAGLAADMREGPNPFLGLAVYDEDWDVFGVGVREGRNAGDGQTEYSVEEYPVFAHDHLGGPLNYLLVPVEIRDSDQRKDGERWQAYALDSKSNENPPRGSTGEAKTPPMYISIPEPNDLAVWVYVYDRSGNKSDPVRLQNAMGPNPGHL